MISQERLGRILKEYRRRLRQVLGEDLHSIILSGSQARGDAVEVPISMFFAL